MSMPSLSPPPGSPGYGATVGDRRFGARLAIFSLIALAAGGAFGLTVGTSLVG